MGSIKTMAKLELCNLYDLNKFRFSREKKVKKKALFLAFGWLIVLAMMFFYIGMLSYAFIQIGIGDVVPSYLTAIASLIIFFFGILKAGNIIFRKNGYDILCSLPVPQNAIVISRFLRLYTEELGFAAAAMAPGLIVYGWMLRPGMSFYLVSILGILLVPLIPMALAVLIGALITAVSSRTKHKSLAATILSIIAVLAITAGSFLLSSMGSSITPEMLTELSVLVTGLLNRIYPPSIWIGTAIVQGDLMQWALCAGVFLAVSALILLLVSVRFHWICQNLYGTFAKHNYRMEKLRRHSVISALCRREFKRYFSSSVYVTNTIVGPLMGTALSAVILFSGTGEMLTGPLASVFDSYSLAPFALASIFCTMTTTATSISLEGKNWWIVKSLPLSAKAIMDAKILMNLLLMLPFYLVSEILLILALKPGILDILWLFLIPAVIILFSCVYGLAVNLHFPVMDWENEASVVKQSLSATLGGMGGFILSILCIAAIVFLPREYVWIFKIGICILLTGAAGILYREICK